MKKILSILVLLVGALQSTYAMHIKGGEMSYVYIGEAGPGNSRYRITLKLYIDCNATSPGQLDPQVPLTFFDKTTGQQFGGAINAPLNTETFIQFDPNSNPCIGNPPTGVCYRVRTYTTEITLPNTSMGYTVAYQRCCRIDNIINLVAPSQTVGATYSADIPGTSVYPEAFKNTSPVFVTNDAAAICVNSSFVFSFAAAQPDADDSIAYRLCSGFRGASQSMPNPTTASAPPYSELGYSSPFSGTSPLGGMSTINPRTGLITGVAPGVLGQYVITACAYEYRKGVLINIHRKDIHVAVSDCIPLRARLKPDYSYCDDFLVTFKNEQVNPPGAQYIWQFGDNTKADTTTDPEGRMSHQYLDTGSYRVKLKVILAGQCIDSTTTVAKVYPGFYPGFQTQGTCLLLPIQFVDTTKSRYGVASKWRWNFGDETTQADTSHLKSPSWKYATTGFKTVELIVESNKGCIDTILRNVEVRDKPPIILPFKDTLICSVDTLQLQAGGAGVFDWGPNYNILNANTPNPLVYPKQTTYYRVTLNENGCVNTDSIRVRVVDFVTLAAGADTTICLTDTIQLRPQSDGLQYIWTPSATLNDANVKNPLASPTATTTYRVRAIIGKCNREDDITVRTVPYPIADAGPDTTICFEDTARLQGSMNGIRFTWSPVNTLLASNTLSPFAYPLRTTSYTLSAYDTLGCPKSGTSIVKVTVRDEIFPFAGNDTSVVVGQPLQLRGSGSLLYEWTPPNFLNDPRAQNPVAILNDNFTYIMRTYTPEGCFAYDTINIKVFKTSPDIFVPNAFSPNGRNRVLRPIPVGISKLEFFRVFNRWGQLVFQTADSGRGWDGTIGGRPQDAGTYIWMVKGVDFTGKVVVKRGTAILIR
jgi:gliding motility-associated-like protein